VVTEADPVVTEVADKHMVGMEVVYTTTNQMVMVEITQETAEAVVDLAAAAADGVEEVIMETAVVEDHQDLEVTAKAVTVEMVVPEEVAVVEVVMLSLDLETSIQECLGV
jgi:hypothetical protein